MTISKSDASKWEVIHDNTDQLYFVVNRNGTRLPSKYTTRTLADKALSVYLTTPAMKRKTKPRSISVPQTPKPITEVLEQLEA